MSSVEPANQINPFDSHTSLLQRLAESKVAANVLLTLMFMAGYWGLKNLNVQFFPSFKLEVITLHVSWQNASPEDVEKSIIKPLEGAIRGLDNLQKVTSTAASGEGAITLTFNENADMTQALEDVKQRVAGVKNLPQASETPVIQRRVDYESVASVLIASVALDYFELQKIARQIEAELRQRGIHKIDTSGTPIGEMSIEISTENLLNYGLTLNEVSQQIRQSSLDAPAGSISQHVTGRDIRVIQQGQTEIDYRAIPIRLPHGETINLSNIATIALVEKENTAKLWQDDKRAIILNLFRTKNDSTLKTAEIIKQWEKEALPKYQDRVDVQIFDKSWAYLEQRINVLVKNGIGGLVLVILMLIVFMNLRVAFWVAMGIPASLMLSLLLLYYLGGSINMVSLFAFIMTLGIIVDDAIVVGEHIVDQHERGRTPLQAATIGIQRMFLPVLAASMTTIAAFIPLTLIGGVFGKFLIAIPIVVISVILASFIESFFILPGHLTHSLRKMTVKARPAKTKLPSFRRHFDRQFIFFRDHLFRRLVEKSLNNRLLIITFTIVCLWIGVTMVQQGVVRFVFFPSVESGRLDLQVSFFSGTPPRQMNQYLQHASQQLKLTNEEFGGHLLLTHVQETGLASLGGGSKSVSGSVGSMIVELVDPDERSVTNEEFIQRWRDKLDPHPAVENLEIGDFSSDPGDTKISFQLFGGHIDQLKSAALELADQLEKHPGISDAGDDLAYGKEQLILSLTPLAKNLNISLENISYQVRYAYDGVVAQIYTVDQEDIEVRIKIPKTERDNISSLGNLQIRLADGTFMPLSNLVTWKSKKSYANIRHYNTLASVRVFATLDFKKITLDEARSHVRANVLPQLSAKYGITYEESGSASRQDRVLDDMISGTLIGLLLIFIILAWVFNSWGWPFVVLAITPFGLFGAIIGHWLTGIELSVLSLFGLFGLSGIVINDSIVLVNTYRQLRQQNISYKQALIDASCQRLRAVLLTSMTTIIGLTPLLFETSTQAQILIPMATTIVFGLFFSTLLVLVLVPILLSLYEGFILNDKRYLYQRIRNITR